jgi:MFS family permease
MARRFGVGPTICLSGALSALGTLVLLLAPPTPVLAMSALVVSQILGDAFGVVQLILAGSLRQTILPQNMLGRVGATFRAVGGGAAVAGALTGGFLAKGLGLRTTLLLAIGGLLIGPLLGILSPLRQVKEMPTDAA